jgi:tetratricopeptide (TPR) repeat protein
VRRAKKSLPLVVLCLLGAASAGLCPRARATPLADATALFDARKYPEARAILEPLAAAEPGNAAAAYILGMTLLRQGGPAALDSSKVWLGKAVKLAPNDAGYLAEYAGVCLLMADRDSSFSLALEGRDGMSRAISENPDDFEAREGLMSFYAKAPWPLGDTPRAFEMAAYVASKDPKRGAEDYRSLAATLRRNGHPDEANSALKLAQSLAPAKAR